LDHNTRSQILRTIIWIPDLYEIERSDADSEKIVLDRRNIDTQSPKSGRHARAESKKQVRPPPDLEILLDLDLAVVVGVQLIQQLVYLLPGDVHVLILKRKRETRVKP
jgi:hypothetical protein